MLEPDTGGAVEFNRTLGQSRRTKRDLGDLDHGREINNSPSLRRTSMRRHELQRFLKELSYRANTLIADKISGSL